MRNRLEVTEINSKQLASYKAFLTPGLSKDAANFRITLNDDLNAPFPTEDRTDSFTLGAYVTTSLAGVVSFTRDGFDREKLKHKGILFRMYVAENFRGLGIARILIESVVERARKLEGLEQINLTVISSNEIAKALYRKIGFETFSREKNALKWNGKYLDEESMVLMLNR